MRIHVSKRHKGQCDVLVEPARRTGLPPVILQGITPENRAERVQKAVEAASWRALAQAGPAGS